MGRFEAEERAGRTTYRMRFSVKQKGEYTKLQELLKFAGPEIRWGHLEKKSEVAIHTIDTLKMLKYLIAYLERFPLKSNKSVAYAK